MSGDPEQDYFCDGTVEDIITGLSRIKWLFVIARNSSFTYKGRSVEVRTVGRELGVRYVLEGSVRKAANRVRITGQLVDATNGAHIWADRFDGKLEDIFDLQDRITASVLGAIPPKLQQAEIERAKRKPTESLDAYDYLLRGMASLHLATRPANDDALQSFNMAIERDPDFAAAYAMASFCYVWRKANGWMTDRARETAECERLARRAVTLGRDDAVSLCFGGFALARVVSDLKGGADYIERAVTLNPNLAMAWQFSGRVKNYLGEPEAAIPCLMQALRLSPLEPMTYGGLGSMALAHFFAGRYSEAAHWAGRAIQENSNYLPVSAVAAASYALAGLHQQAQQAMTSVRQIDPTLRLSNLQEMMPVYRPEDFVRWSEGLRKAGLPE